MASSGEVTWIEAVGRPPASLAWAGVQALRRASVVFAQPGVHPSVLWHAPEAAEVVMGAWEAAEVVARAQSGASVVGVVKTLDVAPSVRASGVHVREVPAGGVGAASGPLAGRRILMTRPRASALPQRERFEALGADAVAMPCLRIEPPDDAAAFDDAVAGVEGYDGLIVSSRAGVEALGQALQRRELDARALVGKTIVAVGTTTQRACLDVGLRPDIVPSRPRSEGIVDALAERGLLAQRWVHVRARDGRATLDDALAHYRLAIGYQAERPPPPPGVISWLHEGVDVICLHSGRTGEHLRATLEEANLGGALEDVRVVSAGPVTTKALQEQGFEVDSTASSPGDDGMVNAVLELFEGP